MNKNKKIVLKTIKNMNKNISILVFCSDLQQANLIPECKNEGDYFNIIQSLYEDKLININNYDPDNWRSVFIIGLTEEGEKVFQSTAWNKLKENWLVLLIGTILSIIGAYILYSLK